MIIDSNTILFNRKIKSNIFRHFTISSNNALVKELLHVKSFSETKSIKNHKKKI